MLKSFRRLFAIYAGYRGHLIWSQVLLAVSAILLVVVATLNQRLINDGLLKNDIGVVVETSVIMIALTLVAAGFQVWNAYYAVFFAQGTAFVVRSELYRNIQTFSFENFNRFRTAGLLVRLNADVNNIMFAVLFMVMLLLMAPFMIITAFILTAITTPQFLWILGVVVLIVIGIMAVVSPQIDKAYIERQTRLDGVNDVLQENLAGIRVVKAFVREDYEVDRFSGRADAMRKPAFAAAFRVAALTPILNTITLGASALVVGLGGRQILEGTGLTLGEIVTFNQYLNLVIVPLALLAVVTPAILRGDTSARRVYEVYDAEATLADDPDATAREPESIGGRIAFEDVSFAFRRPDGEFDPPVLKNLDLVIEPGERIGILGATGSGKTALVNLIPRFHDVTNGRVTLDGVDVREIPKDNLRELVGIALQEALLFQGTVRSNVKFGNADVDDDVMFEAAKAADAYGFVTNLPETWEAHVARRGYNYSGGQRQRLSIARALTALPRVLILDDSTSATDVATEGRIQDAIPRFTKGITTIYVAQRISAVIDLDRIIVLDNGTVDGIGTHDELLETNPLYQEIYESQLGAGMKPGSEVG